MSTGSRARALRYASQVNDERRQRRQKQPNVFGQAQTTPPTYAFMDNPRGNTDDTAKETKPLRDEEKAIRHDAERDVTDASSFQPGQETGKAPTPNVTSTKVATFDELKGAFRKCWTTVDDLDILPVTYYDKSSYIPFALILFQTLFEMEVLLNNNEDLRWHSPSYFSLPVRVYYAVIFYIQTLRAQEQSGTLPKAEGSFLRAFYRRYKSTSCPIAGPLVPILTNIVSCLPDDSQYDYVHPTLPSKGTYSVLQTGTGSATQRRLSVNSTHYVLPSVALVGSFLKKFCTAQQLDDTCFNDMDEFVPVPTTGGDFAGITFPPQTNGQWQHEFAQVLHNPAMMRALPESKSRLKEIHSQWRRSGTRHFPAISMDQSFDPEGPQGHTFLVESFDWFERCIDMATVQTKFFTDSTNLSNVAILGGRSSLVIANISVRDPTNDSEKTTPTTVEGWFPDAYSSLKATFDAYTPELELDEKYNAMFSLTNGVLNWTDNAQHKVGSKDSGNRVGPYWDNGKKTYELSDPRSVGHGLYSMTQTLFYVAKPQ